MNVYSCEMPPIRIIDIFHGFGGSLVVTDNGVNVSVDNRPEWRYRWRVGLI